MNKNTSSQNHSAPSLSGRAGGESAASAFRFLTRMKGYTILSLLGLIISLSGTVSDLFQSKELPCKWLTEMKADLYREDRRTARIFITFSLLAIAVTCLGVLGLMLFDVRRRYREIALRKVHGATFLDIAMLLSRRYLIVFAVAAVASLPVSLLVIHRLMATYTIHTSFAWWIPLLSIALILGLCALTLWQQVWRATRIKPYQILKEQ